MPEAHWRIVAEPNWPETTVISYRLALEVDPRARLVWLGPRVEGSGGIDIQSGAVARSFYDYDAPVDLRAAAEWLATDEALALLATLSAGFHCEVLWTGDPVVSWSDTAWEAGNLLYQRVGGLLASG